MTTIHVVNQIVGFPYYFSVRDNNGEYGVIQWAPAAEQWLFKITEEKFMDKNDCAVVTDFLHALRDVHMSCTIVSDGQ